MICTKDVCSIFQYQQHAHLPFPADPALCLVQFLDACGRLYYPAVPVKTLSHHLPSLKLTSPEAVPCQVLPMDLHWCSHYQLGNWPGQRLGDLGMHKSHASRLPQISDQAACKAACAIYRYAHHFVAISKQKEECHLRGFYTFTRAFKCHYESVLEDTCISLL